LGIKGKVYKPYFDNIGKIRQELLYCYYGEHKLNSLGEVPLVYIWNEELNQLRVMEGNDFKEDRGLADGEIVKYSGESMSKEFIGKLMLASNEAIDGYLTYVLNADGRIWWR